GNLTVVANRHPSVCAFLGQFKVTGSVPVPMQRPLRVGLLIDSLHIPAWRYTLLETLTNSDFATIQLIVLNDSHNIRPGLFHRLLANRHYLLSTAYAKFDNAFFQQEPDAFAPRDASSLLSRIPALKVLPRQTRHRHVITDEDIERIHSYAIDVFIRFGFRILKGGILRAAPFGVWSFHHGDNRVNRGGPAGFWEVFEGHPTTGAVLQILTSDLDSGPVLARAYSETDTVSVKRNCNSHYWKVLSLLPRQLKRLHDLGGEAFLSDIAEKAAEPQFYSRRLYSRPRNLEFLNLLGKLLLRYCRRKLEDAFFFRQWILMLDQRDEMSTSIWRFKRLTPPSDRFWAD